MAKSASPDQYVSTSTAPPIGCAEFFAEVPPGVIRTVLVELSSRRHSADWVDWKLPRVQLYCDHPNCSGVRYFDPTEETHGILRSGQYTEFVKYFCSNCNEHTKVYAIAIGVTDATTANIVKLGEHPAFGPPLSKRLLNLVGESAGLLKKGYRCEKDGLGIGAFGYYRRVLDQQRISIFDRLIEISRMLSAEDVAGELAAARNQTQFKTAIEAVKHGLPQALYVEGHNPLTLLHSALSEGLHELSDEECLETAANVRLVLTELADRLDRLRKDDRELKAAVGRLSRKKR